MDVARLVSRLGGAARRETLLAHGATRHSIYAAARSGDLQRAGPGVFVLPGAPREAVLAATFRGTPTCVTALAQMGLPLLRRDHSCHLWVPRDRARRATDARPARGLVLHREPDQPIGDGRDAAVLLAHASRCLPPEEWLIPVDAALHAGLLTLEQAVESGRRGGFDAAWIRHMADPRAESPAETRARVQILGAGYEVRSQVELESVGRVDFVVEGKVVVETDGKDYHSDEHAFIRDKRRDRAVIRRGMTPLRYAAKEALQWPELVTADLLAVLGPPVRSGAPPRPRRARSRR